MRYQLIHELPGRLRLRVPALNQPECPAGMLERWMETSPVIRSVRVNPRAKAVILEYQGAAQERRTALHHLREARFDTLPALDTDFYPPEDDLLPMVRGGLAMLALPLLPLPVRGLLTLLNVGPTLLHGLDTLVHRGLKMEVLDALAVGLAATGGQHQTANVTDFLLKLGEFLEHRTQRQSDQLLRQLLRPPPALAWVERAGTLMQLSADQVQPGETVVVGVGEAIPVDGWVLSGTALVNQASVTGEDVPVRKEAPARVIAGSTLMEGRLQIEAARVGAETTQARVAGFIQQALDQRSATQCLSERLADQRVSLTLGTGALVYALTRDLSRLQAVFLVDYSCALKLGTPVTFKAALSKAAHHGVLIKGGEAIEQLAEVDTLVFDKTGTLTESALEVTDTLVLDKHSGCASQGACTETDLLALVASVEEHASHPLAQAVVAAAREQQLPHISHGEIDYLVAHGLSADVKGGRIVVGSRHYLEEHMGIRFQRHESTINRLLNEGKTLLYVANVQGPVGVIALRDRPRAEAPEVMMQLRTLGIQRLIMLTGDRRDKAEALAAELGLDEIHAELEPEAKAEIIEQLRAAGRRVAFVGDGINDGPALAAAHVGIAMPRGTDIARATADIVLLEDQLAAIASARALSTGTMQLIRNNFKIAVGVNTALLVGAVFGRISPITSALLHNGTTIGVLLNALRGPSSDSRAP
ncbi:heavy metal translocating P-type ATPase [Rhabdochromatium marinum]|uniref:heavy metal translocating P-type ATPase n=1 Tax=Rhabdochromatium marinum TaxID=48729 RepID=UPI001A927D19|nr:heavy metal translocating P-type ATPase [Rhabdochromatium marinum]MBK1647197.1 heavy metal translocating P-type ATPase [Rhabdochromatium marinum]